MLEHGGRLHVAARRYGIPECDWLDLSTGINPHGYTPPLVPSNAWQRLPEPDDGLEHAAAAYYGTADLLPVAGSQAAIQCLPLLRSAFCVGVLHPGYAEHAHAWHQAEHQVLPLSMHEIEVRLAELDVLVLMNPNNPTGAMFSLEQLHDWHARLAAHGGWLIVDEAFVDVTPEQSAILSTMPPGLVVLRSLGKYFGLAGARVGFVAAEPAMLDALHRRLGPWTLSGPARFVAQAALVDVAWQSAARERLHRFASRLAQLLTQYGYAPDGGCSLFQWLRHSDAAQLHEQLARRGILTRLFTETSSIRFGLPGDENQWTRLASALQEVNA